MSTWHRMWFRARALFRRNRLDADMAEEMRLHLELREERNRAAGMSIEEAHYDARRSFGGVEQIKENAREGRGWLWLEQALQDFRFSARQLAKAPGFTLAAVLSLTIGIGLNTAVFSIINTIFYQSIRGVPEPERVLIFNDGTVTPAGYDQLREQAADVAALSAARGTPAVLAGAAVEGRDRVGLVAPNYFSVLGAQAALGRLSTGTAGFAGEGTEPVAVMSDAYWRNHHNADRALLGSIVRVNGASFTLIGIAAPAFHGPGPEGPALWVPLACAPLIEGSPAAGTTKRLALIGRLRPGVTLANAQAAIDVVVTRSPEIFGEKTRLRLSAGREDWRGDVSPEKRMEFLLVTTVPLVVVAGLLWIACSNVANLLLARAVQRRKEIAIRLASGATRSRLIRMLMGEGLLLALLGGAGGIWVARATIDFVFGTMSNFSAFSVQIDARVLIYTIAVSAASSLLFALVPALQASRTDVNAALKGEGAEPALRPSRLRAFFLTSQIASSVALLIVAGTFVKSLVASAHVGRARQMNQLVFAQLSPGERTGWDREAFYAAAAEKAQAVPGVESATLVEQANPARRKFTQPGEPPAAPGQPEIEVAVQRIDAAYFRTVGAGLQRGAPLALAADAAARSEAVINEAMARRFWSVETAVGRRFALDAQSFEVTGIVSDHSTAPSVYLHRPVGGAERFGLLIRTRGQAQDATAAISAALRGLGQGVDAPVVTPLRELAFRTLGEITRLASFVGVLALALAAAGIYASISFSTSQRTREIGIRVALGATRQRVLQRVLRDGYGVVACGSAFGLVIALVGLRFLAGLMVAPAVFDPIAIGAVLLVFAVVAGLACLLPAYRAMRVDPVVALRHD